MEAAAHVVVIVDDIRAGERIVTVYEPDRLRWSPEPHGEEAMIRCERCDQGERRPEQRARLAEREGRTALVFGVPVEVRRVVRCG